MLITELILFFSAFAFCFSVFGRFVLVPVVSIFSKSRADFGRERSKRLIRTTFYCLCCSILIEVIYASIFYLKLFD